MARMFYCKCGKRVVKRSWLVEHIGLQNPRWPATSSDDEHSEVTEEEWKAKRREQYDQIGMARISYGDY